MIKLTEPITLPVLPPAAQAIAEEMESGKTLGASRNTRQINDLLCAIVDHWAGDSGPELGALIQQVSDYYVTTRGKNTPVIGNALRMVLHGLEPDNGVASLREFIYAQRARYNARSIENSKLIGKYGANLLADCKTIMPFDYSSTMLVILKTLADRGLHKELYVLESRVLDGGRPIAKEAAAWGHRIVFTVDMAFCDSLSRSEAVLIGAESFQADGTVWNTVGSLPIAMFAGEMRVPCYVATELLKVDTRSFEGIRKAITPHDYRRVLDYPDSFDNPESVSVTAPDLDAVPPLLISAYITEQGVLPAGEIYHASKDFALKNGMFTHE